MKQQKLGTQASGNFDARADPRGPERAFAQRNRKAAVAHIVCRIRQLCRNNLTDRLMDTLLIRHVQSRRQAPKILENHLSVLGPTKMRVIAASETAQQNQIQSGLGEMN